MTEEATTTSKVKEAAILKDSSLSALSRVIGAEKFNGLALGMLLNIPNTTIAIIACDASENGLIDASDRVKIEAALRVLLTWKELRAGCKERDKAKELVRAISEMGKPDMAQLVSDKHGENVELTTEDFASLT